MTTYPQYKPLYGLDMQTVVLWNTGGKQEQMVHLLCTWEVKGVWCASVQLVGV
jgi:hypothetical protein